MKLAVIGTAGRKDDAARLSGTMFDKMYIKLLQVIDHIERYGPEPVDTLVSGGAAYADHLAVHHFLHSRDRKLNLELHLPCRFFLVQGKFEDDGSRDWKNNPGGTLNYYHRKMAFDSLDELTIAIDSPGCVTSCGEGLFGRNKRIAQAADAVVAFTFGQGAMLKPGGTADTMQHYMLEKLFDRRFKTYVTYHVDLNTMIAYPQALLPEVASHA